MLTYVFIHRRRPRPHPVCESRPCSSSWAACGTCATPGAPRCTCRGSAPRSDRLRAGTRAVAQHAAGARVHPDFITPHRAPRWPPSRRSSSSPGHARQADPDRARDRRPADGNVQGDRGDAGPSAPGGDRLCDLFDAFWRAAVEPHWPRIHSLLEADLRHRSRRLTEGGQVRLFEDLHPAVNWVGDRLEIEMTWTDTVDLDGKGLLLLPSALEAAPVAVADAPWQPTLIYPARGLALLWEPGSQAGPEALAGWSAAPVRTMLVALSAPRSTTELARSLGLSPGGCLAAPRRSAPQRPGRGRSPRPLRSLPAHTGRRPACRGDRLSRLSEPAEILRRARAVRRAS